MKVRMVRGLTEISTQSLRMRNRNSSQLTAFVRLLNPKIHIVTSRCDLQTGFVLDDWVYCIINIHRVRDNSYHSAITVPHTLQFTVTHSLGNSVFTSRILETDLSQSHCNFKSHAKSSCHSLIPFLPFLQLPIRKTWLIPIPSSYPSRLASRSSTTSLLT
jgi:hypothetical protein